MTYEFSKIEKNAQKIWEDRKVFETTLNDKKPKYYVLDMFPYPSGDGLHVGHVKLYTATDVISRYYRLKGYNVLHPTGWDAFGLPAENYAIKVKKNPAEVVGVNVERFKNQMRNLGFSYDWTREINTTDPEYYKWTQWIFIKMFEKGLAYQAEIPINFCPSCKTGLANEEVVSGECERCGTKVERKNLKQWILKITDYADRLLDDLEDLDWPDPIKEMQKNWIGKSEGSNIVFDLNTGDKLEVYTTRADTLFGCTYLVVAPEHEIIKKYKDRISNYAKVKEYIDSIKSKTELERTDLTKDKTGVIIEGVTAINPINDKEVPVFVADYVLGHYGTGAVMAVPSHDERDFEFAKKYGLEIIQSIAPVVTYYKTPPKDELPWVERTVVEVIVYNPKTNKYLGLKWKKQPWTTFITGEVEKGEEILEAAKREVLEETGFKNIKLKKHLGQSKAVFHAAHKNENRIAYTSAFLFELLDEINEKVSDEEKDIHEFVWLERNDLTKENIVCASLEYWLKGIDNKEAAFIDYGSTVNSEEFSNLESKDAMKKITQKLKDIGHGDFAVNYKLRDWIFSRQRYWGEPIPIIHCEKCGPVAVDTKDLPVKLPYLEDYEPTGTGESPLAKVEDWVKTTCPKCAGPARRETNTMPNWAGSCWYYLRFADPANKIELISKKADEYFSPVDFYLGGAEHAVLHLLYARFWHKFLYDIKVVKDLEPFKKLQNVGLILAPDRQKMSKSKGNVINPDDVVKSHGADALRMYEMFIGPFDQPAVWSKNGIVGTYKFLDKIQNSFNIAEEQDQQIEALLNALIVSISDKIEKGYFNTAVSDFMKFSNEAELSKMNKSQWQRFITILAPFAPHLSEDIFQKIDSSKSVFEDSWPEVNMTVKTVAKYIVQVNGKKKAIVEIDPNLEKNEILGRIYEVENIKTHLQGKKVKKEIFIENKLVNFVV